MPGRMLAVGGGMAVGIIRLGTPLGYSGAVVEIDADRRQLLAEKHGLAVYETIDEALAAHDDYVAAYIATPNDTHAQFALKLAPLGIPVFMEKPLGITAEQCRQVVEAYRQGKGWLQIDFEYRFSPMYRQAGEILHSGEVGELRSIYAEYTRGGYTLDTQPWRLDPDRSGGDFAEKLCHLLDLFRYYSASEFDDIRVTAGPRGAQFYHEQTSDNLSAQFLMQSGVFVNLVHTHGSVALPPDRAPQDINWAEYGHRTAMYLNTTGGCIRIDIWPQTVTVIARDENHAMKPRVVRRLDYKLMPFMASHHDMSGMLRDFVQRVHAGQGPRLPAEDSLKTMLAVFEADRQLRESATAANARFSS